MAADGSATLQAIRQPFGLGPAATIVRLGKGHINRTYLVTDGERRLVAQRINTDVFADPGALVNNARLIDLHLTRQGAELRVARHLAGSDGGFLYGAGKDVRVLEYFPGSLSIEVLETPRQAERAARSFAWFSQQLSSFDHTALETIIPDFHSPALRWRQFRQALAADRAGRAADCQEDIGFVLGSESRAAGWQERINELPVRVCHNDCKINNLLVCRESGQPLAIIDLDTCMPGPVLTDFGDLVRTCCSPEPEDSTRLDVVRARPEVYAALVRGYLDGWKGDITRAERETLFTGGLMMCFVVGLRFLTDYLDGDRYFAVSRKGHNLQRARNQFQLYRSLLAQRANLENMA